MQNKLFLVLTLSLVLGVFSASEVFAEIDYDEIKIESISTVLFERSDVNIIVATVQLSNNSDEKFPSSGNYFYLVSSGKYFDEVSAYDIEIKFVRLLVIFLQMYQEKLFYVMKFQKIYQIHLIV